MQESSYRTGSKWHWSTLVGIGGVAVFALSVLYGYHRFDLLETQIANLIGNNTPRWVGTYIATDILMLKMLGELRVLAIVGVGSLAGIFLVLLWGLLRPGRRPWSDALQSPRA